MTTDTVLSSDERDKFVGDLIDYGTDFVAPLYAVVESIEQAVLQSPGVQRLRRIAQALDYKIEAYERYGAICEFEGEPMIHASNLEEMRDAAMEKQP